MSRVQNSAIFHLLTTCAVVVCLLLPYAAYAIVFSAWDAHKVLIAILAPVGLGTIAYLCLRGRQRGSAQ